MNICFDNSYARLPDRFFAKQQPAPVPAPTLIRCNDDLAARLSIDTDWLQSEDGLAVFAGNRIPDGAEPLAQAYAGHQFGGFSPQLGDGRALLLGEVLDVDGVRQDVQLKGSGRTPFSRGGDGKSALGPVLREYVVSEAMAALGVPTTRALAAVASGERVMRQEGMISGGVFTRVATSHIRVGTFQYFAERKDTEAIRLLADHAIERHYPTVANEAAPYAALLESVVLRQADLIAQWMSLGFIHGVMNTDNTAISGETIDYGPCAFMDAFHPKCVFSSIDTGGRYAWGNQPNIGLWNVSRFAETLVPLLSDSQDDGIKKAEHILSKYSERFGSQYIARFRAKLALPETAPVEIIHECLELMSAQAIDFTVFFRKLTTVANGEESGSVRRLYKDPAAFDVWFEKWSKEVDLVVLHAVMRGVNPVRIPRNHRVEQVIQSAYNGEYAPFHRLVDALALPFSENVDYADYEAPPRPEEVVRETFCGT